jgi:peptidyl-prolyl cis-trans isomerase A (cyclophilin A)
MKHLLAAVLMCSAAFAQPKAAPAKPNLMEPKSLNAKAPETFNAKFTTTKGDFVIQVNRAWAPHGADRFYNLVRAGFFKDVAFFRVLSGFMAQFGISGDPAVARAWMGANIPDDAVRQSNKRGRVTFATAGPNTRTTQLFINFGDNAGLDSQGFAPIGEVVEGMSVVDSLYSGYGEGAPRGRGPDQGRVQAQGNAYLKSNFPQLDRIISATIVPASAPAAAEKK